MTDIYLCRHGRTPLNVAGRLRGHLDPALDLVGEAEARDLAEQLGGLGVVRVISSPLGRAMQTATPIATAAGLQVETDDRLLDRGYGSFDGAVEAEVVEAHGSLDAAPGVEPSQAVLDRAVAALEEYAVGDDPIVVVSHDAVIRLVLNQLDPSPGHADHVQPRTGCWSLLRRDASGWQLIMANSKDDPIETALAKG